MNDFNQTADEPGREPVPSAAAESTPSQIGRYRIEKVLGKGGFPRNHRFVLGERIERNLYDLLETLIQAKFTKQRQPLLEKADLMLEILRFQMRLAKDLHCLKVEYA
jgi:hypothetical protein